MRDEPASCLELLLWWLLPYPLILAAHYLGVLWRAFWGWYTGAP